MCCRGVNNDRITAFCQADCLNGSRIRKAEKSHIRIEDRCLSRFRILALITLYGLPVCLKALPKSEDIVSAMRADKKRSAGRLRFVLLKGIGHAFIADDVTDDEMEERIEEFFRWCVDTGTGPTMERFALAIGTTRETIRRWRNGIGCSDARKYMMQQAVEMMAAYDADMVLKGKMPVVPYIFRGKNYYDMEDNKRVIVDANIEKVQSAESLIAEARNLAGDFIDGEYEEVKE